MLCLPLPFREAMQKKEPAEGKVEEVQDEPLSEAVSGEEGGQPAEKNHTEEKSMGEKDKGQNGSEEDETKAAVVLQSNYRGYRERKKFKEGHQGKQGDKMAADPQSPGDQGEEKVELAEEAIAAEDAAAAQDPATTQEQEGRQEAGTEVDPAQEAKAATVIQSNFRGHRERKKLEGEGKLPASGKRTKASPEKDQPPPEPKQDPGEETNEKPPQGPQQESPEEPAQSAEKEKEKVEEQSAGLAGGEADEAKAATVLQSNFRGHKERQRLQEEGKLPKKKTQEGEKSSADKECEAGALGPEPKPEVKSMTEEPKPDSEAPSAGIQVDKGKEEGVLEPKEPSPDDQFEQEQAAVKIQSNFRGYKDRKNLKMSAEKEMEELVHFSQQVRSWGQN